MLYRASFRAEVFSAGKEKAVNCFQQGVQGREAAIPSWVQCVCGSGVVPGRAVQVPALGWGHGSRTRLQGHMAGWAEKPRSISSGSAFGKAAQLLTLGSAWIPNKLCVHRALSPLITLPGPGCLCAWDRADPGPQSIPREQLRAAHGKHKPRFFCRTGGSIFCLLCPQSVLSFLLLSLMCWKSGIKLFLLLWKPYERNCFNKSKSGKLFPFGAAV